MLLGSKPVISRRNGNSTWQTHHVLSGHLWSLQISSSVRHQGTGARVQSRQTLVLSEEHRQAWDKSQEKREPVAPPKTVLGHGGAWKKVNLPA